MVEKLSKMGYQGPSRCLLCKSSKETIENLLLGHPFAQRGLLLNMARQVLFQRIFLNMFKSWPILKRAAMFSSL